MNAFQRGEAAMRGTPSDFGNRKRKSPQRMLPARALQTRFDDGIMPVFCPTCQSSNATGSRHRNCRDPGTSATARKSPLRIIPRGHQTTLFG